MAIEHEGPAVPQRLRGYVRGRAAEIAKPTTRASSEPLAEWALRRIRLDGRPFSFTGHEYLRAIYDDTAAHLVLCKAAQIGGTSLAILRSIHSCVMGLGVMYLFPTKTDVLDFSRSRVTPLLAQNPFLAKLVKDTDTIGLKRIGDAHLYLRGMQSEIGIKSVPADLIVFDELDEATPMAKTMALERLSHSDYKRVVELSNPSLPDYGVDEVYQRSDQRHWTIRCSSCGHWTALDKEFPRRAGEEVRVILPRKAGDGFYRACVRCEGELDLAAGEWVADFPDRATHGYLISQLFSSKVDPGEILRDYRTTRFLDRFYNLKIGIAWADRERRLDAASVLALCGDEPMVDRSEARCTMGIDTGSQFHVVVLRRDEAKRQHVIHVGVYHEFAELDALMNRFHVDRCVVDGLPETHATRAFAKRHPSKVFLCYFSEHQRGEATWEAAKVTVNRTDALDASRAAILEAAVVLPRRQPIVETFAQHLTADAKVLDEDEETGAKRFRYIRTGADHFSLAFTYAWMAATVRRPHEGLMEWMRLQAQHAAEEREARVARVLPPEWPWD